MPAQWTFDGWKAKLLWWGELHGALFLCLLILKEGEAAGCRVLMNRACRWRWRVVWYLSASTPHNGQLQSLWCIIRVALSIKPSARRLVSNQIGLDSLNEAFVSCWQLELFTAATSKTQIPLVSETHKLVLAESLLKTSFKRVWNLTIRGFAASLGADAVMAAIILEIYTWQRN
jgi:hypothetical protein